MCKFNWDFGPPGQTGGDVDLEDALGHLEDVFKEPLGLPELDFDVILNDSAGSACEASQERERGRSSEDEQSEADPSWNPALSKSEDQTHLTTAPSTSLRANSVPKRNGKGRGRGRGRARSSASEEEKKQRNRAIQARYRQKKKAQREAVEVEYLNTLEDLERERAEYESRSARVAMLERIREVKDASVAILEDSKMSCSQGKLSSSLLPELKSQNYRLPLKVIEDIYNRLSDDIGHAVMTLSEACRAMRHLSEENNGDLMKADPNYGIVVEYVRHMTGKQLIEGWRNFARALSTSLQKENYESNPAELNWALDDLPGTIYNLKPAFQEQLVIISTALQINIHAVEELFETTVASTPMEMSNRWQEIIVDMGITPKQRSELLKLFERYCNDMEVRQSNRMQAISALLDATDRKAGSLSCLVKDYLNLYECTAGLASSPQIEMHAFMDLMHGASNILSLYQRAKMVSMACPGFPDIIQLMLALEQQETSTDWN